ncbi:hypothetical protein C8R44DRAFT_891844 [Mycena epipterygia]|nr:hypothetical protein C8R44DRAFT_891844 [Mycena epipterygia]
MEEVEEEDMPQVYAPLTNTPHILELVPVNARGAPFESLSPVLILFHISSLSPETPSRTPSPRTYVPNTDSTTVLGKRRASPTDEPEPNLEPAAIASHLNTHTRPAPHTVNNLGAGSSRSVDPTTVAPAHSLPTPEDLFHSLREPSSSRPKPVPGSNTFYMGAGIMYSSTNLADLFDESEGNIGIPNAVELCCLPNETLSADSFSDRGDRGTHDTGNAKGDIMMEVAGYTVGGRSPRRLVEEREYGSDITNHRVMSW